jgi:hypothetical protein
MLKRHKCSQTYHDAIKQPYEKAAQDGFLEMVKGTANTSPRPIPDKLRPIRLADSDPPMPLQAAPLSRRFSVAPMMDWNT